MAEISLDLTESFGLDVPWTAEDAAATRAFLGSTTGKRFLGNIFFRRPACSERSDPFKRGIQSAIGEGYDEALHFVRSLADSTKSVKTPK